MRKFTFSILLVLVTVACSGKKNVVLRNPGSPYGNQQAQGSQTFPTQKPDSKIPAVSQQYIQQYRSIAIREMNRYGIPASIKLAQGILESGNGTSLLATRGNNHFGIKCGGTWRGKNMKKNDDRSNECFRVYDSPEQSFRDHSEFLLKERYQKLFTLDKNDYRGWAYGLKAAGYATNPRYPELLISLIERYELYKYDNLDPSYAIKEYRKDEIKNTVEPPKAKTKKEKSKGSTSLKTHEVTIGDTLYSIGKKYNVSVESIVQQNSLKEEKVHLGQLLVISQ